MIFRSPSKGEMSLQDVAKDIKNYTNEDIKQAYKLIVGTDSQNGQTGSCFVSAIIIHRIGKGARYYYSKHIIEKVSNMKQRIFYEASLSLELADKLSEQLKNNHENDMKVEIHLDIGTRGETKELVKEIVGMIVGSGFDAKIKPNASGASSVADKHTKW
ncbi:DUF458 domain-containing protein [Candidatus Syntrophocurvum alkaliphilum]|uniref:DUF458 domain-containing protein n=1 Tax=Candidatus Syntrophocurvum alkaliphilum TaxID=2293317 RepID=A0A6I6DN12_9FIRM|nr:ribonuclease H-like YkuK family protein [Candidatus Syntrophocurvum alkaliphilum]QGU00571.1 DUF458 domain-containing protein [Candidatus Syntrophocurvum alkaliphilum]